MQPTEIILATYSSQQKKTVIIRNNTKHSIVIKVVRDDSTSVPYKGLYYLNPNKFFELPVTVDLPKLKAQSAVSFYVRNVIESNSAEIKDWLLKSNNEQSYQLAAKMKLVVSKERFSASTVILDITDKTVHFDGVEDDTKTCRDFADEAYTAQDFAYEDFEGAVASKIRKADKDSAVHCDFFQQFLNSVFLPARANA